MRLQEDMLFDDRYLLVKMLGSGGFSEVWLVEDTKVANKRMALKIFVPDRGLDENGVQLFSKEFELVFDLNHANLLRPAHFDVCDRSPYLLMPFCEQGSVGSLVGQLTEDDAWHILHDVASGLAFLHAQEPPIIHQDIKPDNILKDNLGQYLITDFGISTQIRNTLRVSMKKTSSSGTLAFMPPERFGKENIPIKASDIWAMGAAIFELITGHLPFGEHGGLIQKSGAEIPNIHGTFSKDLQEIIIRCMLTNPWDRPVAQQIVEWTDKHFRGEKIHFDTIKKKQTTVQIPKMELPVKKIALGVAGCAIVALLVLLVIKVFKSDTLKELKSKTKTEKIVVEEVVPETTAVPAWITDYEEALNHAETAFEEQDYETAKKDYLRALTIATQNQDQSRQTIANEFIVACNEAKSKAEEAAKAAEKQTAAATVTTPATPATPPAWTVEYNRIIALAQTALNSQNFETAKEEYNKALEIATKNRDRKKQADIKDLITACDEAAKRKAEDDAAKLKARQERLASYNFVGNFQLGSSYMIVQRKSDMRWGIIDKDGNEVEAAIYTDMAARLKNGNCALKNAQGWVVFDASLNKVATGLNNLDAYK